MTTVFHENCEIRNVSCSLGFESRVVVALAPRFGLSYHCSYQAFQHFITHAPWTAEAVWTRLRAAVPERVGGLMLDGTSFPKQGTASVGVARQYCGARGKIANCQTAVTVALWTGARAWLLGAQLYLPEAWLTPRQRTRAQIPATVQFEPK